MPTSADPFAAIDSLAGPGGALRYWRLDRLGPQVAGLPYSIKVLLEAALRGCDGFEINEDHVRSIAAWTPQGPRDEIPFLPGRVVLQDFTGVPAVVDLAAMRDAVTRLGGDPKRINPQVPCDLIIDHSVQVDSAGSTNAFDENLALEFQRNRERYAFLRWGQQAFANFRVVPPATGIIHQVNLEYLAGVVLTREQDGVPAVFPDSLVGTDSHSTMINGLGVLGWGVGGIEAEAVMLGKPMSMLLPDVIGVELSGTLTEGVTATDLVLTITRMLRAEGVVEKFVEFCGPGLDGLSLADRATIANMAPEYGATCGFFPVDGETLRYLRLTGRDEAQVALVEAYCRAQGMFRDSDTPTPSFSKLLRLDLASVRPCLAGPKRPQDLVLLDQLSADFAKALTAAPGAKGLGVAPEHIDDRATLSLRGEQAELRHGAVVIASITSCTNTSNPSVIMAAGLLAQKAAARGLRVPAYVKTSLSPGSRVVTAYLDAAGLTPALDQLGFQNVGYGCTTCIGNGGTLDEPLAKAIAQHDLVAVSVLSGNRNFEGRISPHVKANYLASPPLVVAYALAGNVLVDLATQALGQGSDGKPVMLADIWPSQAEIAAAVERAVTSELFRSRYADVFTGTPEWQAVPAGSGDLYDWDEASTYIQNPPYFEGMTMQPIDPAPIVGARVLALLGDSVTTDHISPAGNIAATSPAGAHLIERGVQPADFNQYGARRGNDRVMTRGTFANIRLRNLLCPGTEGGVTIDFTTGQQASIFAAAQTYAAAGIPLVVLAGKEYGTGSSRDWAAKGTRLLGVRAVIAESFERIHRSNLIGMGILPLVFRPGENAQSLGLTGHERIDIPWHSLPEPRQELTVHAHGGNGSSITFTAICRLDTPVEGAYWRQGGILHAVIRELVSRG